MRMSQTSLLIWLIITEALVCSAKGSQKSSALPQLDQAAKPKANQQPKKKSFRSLTLDFGVNDNIDLLDALSKNQTKEDKTELPPQDKISDSTEKEKILKHSVMPSIMVNETCDCKPPWFSTDTGCYFASSSSCKKRKGKTKSGCNWFQAKQICKENGGTLAEIHSPSEQTKILTILDSNKDSLLSPYWIGLGLSDKGKFEFKNKSSFSNESWCRNFPKDMKFKKCVYLTPVTKITSSNNQSRCWENASCHLLRLPLCQKSIAVAKLKGCSAFSKGKADGAQINQDSKFRSEGSKPKNSSSSVNLISSFQNSSNANTSLGLETTKKLNDIEKDTEDDQEDNDESGTGNEELISDDSDKSKLKDKDSPNNSSSSEQSENEYENADEDEEGAGGHEEGQRENGGKQHGGTRGDETYDDPSDHNATKSQTLASTTSKSKSSGFTKKVDLEKLQTTLTSAFANSTDADYVDPAKKVLSLLYSPKTATTQISETVSVKEGNLERETDTKVDQKEKLSEIQKPQETTFSSLEEKRSSEKHFAGIESSELFPENHVKNQKNLKKDGGPSQHCVSSNGKEYPEGEYRIRCNYGKCECKNGQCEMTAMSFKKCERGCYRGQNFFAHGDIYNGDCFKCPCRCPYQQGSEDNPCYFDTPNCKKKDKCSESKEKDELKEINSQN